jgi:muramidase (phage lysozyme)
MSGSPTGDFLSSFSTSYTKQKDYLRQKQDIAAEDQARRDAMREGAYQGMPVDGSGENSGAAGPAAGYAPAASSNGGGSYQPDGPTTDPVNTTLAPYQRAALNAISYGESPGGAYDVRYTPQGGAKFDLNGTHPRIYEPGPAGKSSAAGRYQFTWSTWKDTAGADTPFTPENQDKYAWQLAASNYGKRTGRNLDADLQVGGMTPEIMNTLQSTWTSMNSNQGGRSKIYADSLARYSTPAAPVERSVDTAPLSFGQTMMNNLQDGFKNSPLGGVLASLTQ